MEDRKLVAKALLQCYIHIEDIGKALSESAEKCAENGFYAIYPNEQMVLYERLIGYNDRKSRLYTMKYVIEEGWRLEKPECTYLLKELYAERKSKTDLIKEWGISLRTLYRRLGKCLGDFCASMDRIGFNQKRILTEFGDEPLFGAMLTRVIREDDEANEIKNKWKSEEAEPKNQTVNNPRRNRPSPDRSGYNHAYV